MSTISTLERSSTPKATQPIPPRINGEAQPSRYFCKNTSDSESIGSTEIQSASQPTATAPDTLSLAKGPKVIAPIERTQKESE